MRTVARHSAQDSRWLPASRAGLWAVGLAALAVTGIVGTAIAFALGVETGDEFFDNSAMSLIAVTVLLSAVASVLAGIDALARRHDRARLVMAAVVAGGLVTLVVLQQVAEGLGWLSS